MNPEDEKNSNLEEIMENPLAIAEHERDQMKALAQRTQADFVNYKRRMEEERQLISQVSAGRVIVRILSIVDDLGRAIDLVPQADNGEWLDGSNLILQNLESLIAAEGFEKFVPLPGEAFDPGKHEAIHYLESKEQPHGCVINTFRAGYIAGERVLRPAQVIVANDSSK